MHQSSIAARVFPADVATCSKAPSTSPASSSPGHVSAIASRIRWSELPSRIHVRTWLTFAAQLISGFADSVATNGG